MVTFNKGAGGRAKPCEIDGIRFASQAEGRRYLVLRALERTKNIKNLICHPKYDFDINGTILRDQSTNRKITYSADFEYLDMGTGLQVVEDVKGFKKGKPIQTPEYRIKKALMWAVNHIKVIEVNA